MVYDCIIIGAGAAGLFCGASFPKRINGLILEKTKRIGTKLLMSGSGQCNVTHNGSIKDFIPCYGKNGGKIRNCLYQYHNEHLCTFLQENGIETFTREDGKIFPKSLKAVDVRDMLLKKSIENGFAVCKEKPVTSIRKNGELWELFSEQETYLTHNIIIATGGCSYPSTGSDGSIYEVLKQDLQLDIIQLKPALSPLKVQNYPFSDLAGISFQHAEAVILHKEKRVAGNTGGLLLTHRDFSGPAVMNISKYAENGDQLKINYLSPLTYEEAHTMLKKAMNDSKESTANILSGIFDLPKRFTRVLADRCGNSPKTLAKALTGDAYIITSIGSYQQAMATSGGISLKEINPKTMELKNHPGLFAIGEVIDIDGITGGYNLQFAYSSANAAVSKIITLID